MQKYAYFKGSLFPYLLLGPQLIIIVVFFYWPVSQAVWQSFLIQDAFGTSTQFVWGENYERLFAEPNYYRALATTLLFSSLVAALSLGISLLLAVQADKQINR